MFYPDVIHLRQFYASAFGERVRLLIGRALEAMWPSANKDSILAIGYATPYIDHLNSSASPLLLCVPAEQGAVAWPQNGPNRVTLAHESELPFQSNSVNRVLLVHSVENSEQLSGMMEEIWRVLTPGGRVLAVVPNRVSLWSGSSKSPFGFGRPFNVLQLRSLFTKHNFTLTRTSSALFTPPICLRASWRLAQKVEMIGKICWWFMGGVLLVEAEKQLYASIKQPIYERRSYGLRLATRRAIPAAQKQLNDQRPERFR